MMSFSPSRLSTSACLRMKMAEGSAGQGGKGGGRPRVQAGVARRGSREGVPLACGAMQRIEKPGTSNARQRGYPRDCLAWVAMLCCKAELMQQQQ